MRQKQAVEAVKWEADSLVLLDQRILPAQTEFIRYEDTVSIANAIRDMVVRGAPAIGITAAYGVVIAAREARLEAENWQSLMPAKLKLLADSRPTAVNLFWALECMGKLLADGRDSDAELLAEAKRIHDEDIQANKYMGQLGSAYLNQGDAVLTHCNAGALATGGYGTALGVIRTAWADGKLKEVFADETRPWLQGARLTAWEMVQENIPVTVLAEGGAAALMEAGKVQWLIVGSDRIAGNGDVANKVGTAGAAIIARHFGVKVMVVAPTSTIDMSLTDGSQIPIEHRSDAEVLGVQGHPIAAEGAKAWNPSFDVTPAALVDVIVTEKGVVEKPDAQGMAALFG